MDRGRKRQKATNSASAKKDAECFASAFDQLRVLYKQQLFCDTCLRSATRDDFFVHRVVLASCSHYFKSVQMDRPSPVYFPSLCTGFLELPELDSRSLQAAIDYCYSPDGSTLQLDSTNVIDLFRAGFQLQIGGMVREISSYLRVTMTSTTCVSVWDQCESVKAFDVLATDQSSLQDLVIGLQQAAENFLARNFARVSSTDPFKVLSLERVLKILQLHTLPKDAVCDAANTWLQHDLPNRQQYAEQLPLESAGHLLADIMEKTFSPKTATADNAQRANECV
jgi:hypothetical protein